VDRPVLVWLRRDLRLGDHEALTAARDSGRPVIPVFILDEVVEALGAAPKWRLGLAVEEMKRALEAIGSRLILRRGRAIAVLQDLIAETGARAVYWSRLYDPASIARDRAIKARLTEAGTNAASFRSHVLFEPWKVATGAGSAFKVYTPFWRAVRDLPVAPPLPATSHLPGPMAWPVSDRLDDWHLGAGMNRGAAAVLPHLRIGEAAALERLSQFLSAGIDRYAQARDLLAEAGTSGLSENLTYGEISVRAVWHAGQAALIGGQAGAETFLKELAWREFAHHLLFHNPAMAESNWRPDWDRFPWRGENEQSRAWRRGVTGEPIVDAAMRQMYVTGTMHNRARMIVASYPTKHLLTDWRLGAAWFADCLTDWDPASNAMGWQWVAGSGPDAAPFFRIFNPRAQAEKFDPEGLYRHRWIAEGQAAPATTALSYFDAVPRRWNMSKDNPYPAPIVDLSDGRTRALAAFRAWKG
jgi:deoxyribodipyrimidine photo-lyase